MKKVLLIYVIGENAILRYEDVGMCMIASVINKRGNPMHFMTIRYPDVNWEEIQDYHPDVIGFTVYSNTVSCISAIIDKIHEILPNVKYIIGGPHAAFNSEAILETNKHINYVVRGEGEETIVDLLDMIDSNQDIPHTIDGITYRDNDNNICLTKDREPIKDLDSLPFVMRNLIYKDYPMAIISTSRGCRANCSFCARISHWAKWRGRSPKNVVDEIELIKSESDIKAFGFIDSSFEDPDNTLERLKAIANEIIERKQEIYYFAYFRARFHRHATDEIMQLLVKSGLCVATLGIEACNEDDLRLYNKPADPEDNHKAMQLFQKYDIGLLPGFINFNPYSTMERVKKNYEFLRQYNFSNLFFSNLVVFENTEIYNKLKKDNLITGYQNGEYTYKYSDATIERYRRYIQKFIDTSNTYDNSFRKYVNFTERYLLLLNYSKKKIRFDGNEKAIAATEEAANNLRDAFTATNRFVEEWVEETLSVENNDFDKVKINYELFASLVESMETSRSRFFLTLTKHGYGSLVHKAFLT